SEEGIYGNGVQYTYLFKFDDEAVIVRTPVLFDTGYKGYDGLNELGYYISFGGERYTCASEYVPLTNGNSTERFTNWQRMGGEQRKLIADAPVFTVERCSLSEYDAIANGFLSVSSRETVTREEYIKQYERAVEAARNGGKTADATPTPYTTPAPPAPTPTKPAADESETAELVRREIDMDGNGKPELLAVYETIPAGGAESSSTLIIEITDGEEVIFSRQLDSFHMNRNSFSLVTDGEKQFILEYTPYISTGIAFYSYALYGKGQDGTFGVTDSGEVRFNSYGKEALPAAEMEVFAGKVNAYLSGSEIIVSTLGGSPVTSWSIPEECFAIFNDVLDPAGYPSLEAWLEECSRILQDNYRGTGG
ncbi:MAG: hypothetical protein J5950_06880, partial [Clostridia bacterium]|nr:hypothetical protein [Clostridia bacterium]